MTNEFKNNTELFDFARSLRDLLKDQGCVAEANELSEVVDTAWTTASEALGELKLSLMRVGPCVKPRSYEEPRRSLQ
jgi:hypothetical protein